ncbi:aromatic ring-hydroxylating dioxygenase subunit alpha [Alphaproteobacteria bacterium]|jgi:phenylpropionate dioxygenase-like ring-hydroxylating dioxygenase large terminal subunit|nr:aromatic ring-hydroxylating dioxygenase subunit alpha [Alphaproteobacteria bacterium]|tara:strand:+ start:50 stop:1192 length:1143 start_codon:yes stop_codon:yes gene_type:complete
MHSTLDIKDRLQSLIVNKETDYAKSIYKNAVIEYIDASIANTEKKIIFEESPICLGTAALVPNQGDWFTVDIGDKSILIVRNNKTEISAYLNICSHRGAKLVEGSGTKAYAFKCPYHSWVYNLDGELKARPRENAFEEINKDQCSLQKFELDNHQGFLWLIMDKKAKNKHSSNKADLNELLIDYDFNKYQHFKSIKIYPKLNWKLAVDTFLELYHIDELHTKSLAPIIKNDLQLFDTYGKNIRVIGARHSAVKLNRVLKDQREFDIHTIQLRILFPNTILVCHPDHVEVWQILPKNEVNECEVSFSLYTKEAFSSKSAIRHWDNNFNLALNAVVKEDFPLGENVQKGFYAAPKRKIIFGKNEPALQHFHKQIKLDLNLSV